MIITHAKYPRAVNRTGSFEFDQLIKQQDFIWDKSSTLQTDCIANQIAMSDLNFYNMELFEDLVTGKIGFEYFKLHTIHDFVEKYASLFKDKQWANKAKRLEGHSLSGAMLDIYDWCIDNSMNELEAMDVMGDLMFPPYISTYHERMWVLLTYNRIKRVLGRLHYHILNHRFSLPMSQRAVEAIGKDIESERYDGMRELFTQLSVKHYRNSLACLNLRPVGFGLISFALPIRDDKRGIRNLSGWKNGLMDYFFNDTLFYYLTQYDATIISHGDELVCLDNDIIIQPTRNPYRASVPSYKSASKLVESFIEYNMIERINLLVCNANKQRLYPRLYNREYPIVVIYEGNVIIG